MKKTFCLLMLLCLTVAATSAHAQSLSLDPSAQDIGTGDTASVDLNISGFSAGGPISLGAFGVHVSYDPNLLAFDSLEYGASLGDPGADEADTWVDSATPGIVKMDNISWLSTAELDSAQPGSFTLATLIFVGIGAGSGVVELSNVDLSTAPGETVAGTVPEAIQINVALTVAIDIKPDDSNNTINNNGKGVIPVAILSNPNTSFDATQVDPATVELEGMRIKTVGKAGKFLSHVEDVNGDSVDDLLVQIQDQDGTFEAGDTTATLTGQTFDGTPIRGSDKIRIVPQ